MMRFILDCLRAGRRRAACARENSVELQGKEKEAVNDEIKGLDDVVAMEEGALQKERTLSRDTQQALENLAKRRAELKEQVKVIQEQRKQEGQLLLSLQEEKEELEQMVQEYENELHRANEELQHLREEISKTRARVEDAHGLMGPLKHSIGDTYTEITETKERLSELIAEMIAIEACVPEITCQEVGDPLSIDLDNSSEEEDENIEECYGHVHELENTIKPVTVEHSEQEQNVEGREKLQRSAENLKSSGSSSFTEITLTEVKEEDVSPGSDTPQHVDSPDLEEDFEIVQSLEAKHVNEATDREFDFFHADPFVDHDVFGDDRFPKVDMTEFLSGDPFKGSDPFAYDSLFNDVAEDHFSQGYPLTEESNAKEPDDQFSFGHESSIKDKHVDISSNVATHISAGANYSQSIDSGMFEQNALEPSDSERYTPYGDICPDVGTNITASQELDSMEQNNTTRIESSLPESSQLDEGGRFDPIHCELHDSHESISSDSSTVNSSFDADFGTSTGMEHPEGEPEFEAGPSYVRRNQALRGLQRIDTSSYTSFPLSPEEYVPESDVPVTSDQEKSVHVADPFSFHSDYDADSEIKPEIEDVENLSPQIHLDPSPLCQEFSDPSDFDHTDHASPEPNTVDAYDHKFGDIYFFTVRLDPGSPDASPVSGEASDRKKSECDHTSPESNDSYEFECGGPEDEDPNQYSLEAYAEESFDEAESQLRKEQPLSEQSPESNEPVQSESEMGLAENIPYPEHEDQSASHDIFDHSAFNFESNNGLEKMTENLGHTCNAGKSANCENESVVPYLISPVSNDTGMVTTDGHKLCAHNPFSLESGSIDHCDNFESNAEPLNKENYTAKDLDAYNNDPFGPIAIDNTTCKSEVTHPNSVSTDGGRLDSGYHENSGLDPFSAETHPSSDMSSNFVSPNPEMLSSGILDLEAPDPFSPELNDTMIFDSELCNASASDGLMKESCNVYTASADVLGDSFSGSELDSFDPFSPVPHMPGGSYAHCNMDILVPGLIQNNSRSDGETRSSSCDSGVSYSPQLHCGSAQNREDVPVNPANQNLANSYLPDCLTEDFFGSDCSSITDGNSFQSKVNKKEQDNNSKVTEIAEIDVFCSELSKMVASRSSDSVQQSVAEMLFGSNPDTAKFYPWDFENSNTDASEFPCPEVDFDNSNKFSRDRPKLEAAARSIRSTDLLSELQSSAGHTLDETGRPSLL